MRKIPEDAFAFYVALGPESRSYELVAKHFHVTKKTVVRAAEREQWQARLEGIERKAREETDAKLANELHAMNMRHRKLLIGMASRAASAIQAYPLKTAMEGIKAAEIAIKLERLMAGEPTETRTVSIEQITRDEVGRFLVDDTKVEEWDDDDVAAEPEDAGGDDEANVDGVRDGDAAGQA